MLSAPFEISRGFPDIRRIIMRKMFCINPCDIRIIRGKIRTDYFLMYLFKITAGAAVRPFTKSKSPIHIPSGRMPFLTIS